MDYKNNIFILRNIHKTNDEELINYTFEKILPKIFNYYKENRNREIYNIDNCYKKYYSNLYLELLEIYNLTDLSKLMYRKNNYNKIEYIIKLLKEKNIKLDNYREKAKKILSIENIKNYSLYIDEKYLNKKRIKKYVWIVINTIMDVKKYNLKMCALKFFKKPLVENLIHDISKNVCFEILKKPLVENVIHDISKNVCFEIFLKTISRKCNS